MFMPAPPHEVPHTSTATTTATKDRPSQTEVDEKRAPTTSIPTPQAISSQASPASMVYVSAISIQAKSGGYLILSHS